MAGPSDARPLWIMIAGPYTSGGADERQRRKNLAAMNRAAVEVFRRGHIPIIGVNMALPMIGEAGPAAFDELMMPVSLALAERCDALLRIGGPSEGADQEMERIRSRGLPVFHAVEEIPRH